MQATTRNSANVMISLLHSSFEYCSMLNVLLLRDFVTDLQNEINKKNETISGESCFVALGTILYFQFRQKGKGAIYMGKRACICQFLDFGAT